MAAFDDVKAGDPVMVVRRFGAFGFSQGRCFYVPDTVERVTPKRFFVAGKQYDKKDGCLIGGYGSVFKPGEKPDQREEASKYHKRMNALYNVGHYICTKYSELITDDEIEKSTPSSRQFARGWTNNMDMTPKEQIEIIAAFDRGEVVQWVPLADNDWRAHCTCMPGHAFNFARYRYRVKHKPLELWVNVYPEPRTSAKRAVYESKDDAIRFLGANGRTAHMIEVQDD